MHGTVEEVLCKKEGGDPYAFIIRGSDQKTYFAHLGDLSENEDKLYRNTDTPTVFLKKGDEVEFKEYLPKEHLLAINVHKKITN